MGLEGQFFTGGRSEPAPATLELNEGKWCVRAHGAELRFGLRATKVSSRLAQLPRRLVFDDGSEFVTADNDAIDRLLQQAGKSRTANLVDRLESNWHWALASLVLTVVAVYAALAWGFPWLARPVAESMPQAYLERIDDTVMAWFDERFVKPSELPESEQYRLRALLGRLPDNEDFKLTFRTGFGANALALPGGTIIVTDELVELVENDNEILAVLAHEAGHVTGRHGMRNIIQSAGVATLMAWLLGDLSAVIDFALVTAPVTLQQLSYARGFEREADAYARDVLEQLGASPACFAEILLKIEASHGGRASAFPRYLLTHPTTEERAEMTAGAPPCS